MVERRAAALGTRSIKAGAKKTALDLVLRSIDLTTLEGMDTPGHVRALCGKARQPDPDFDAPSVAAVCVYPSFVGVARAALEGSSVRVAAVAAAFPSGQSFLDIRLEEIGRAVDAGAHEVDMVMSRQAFLIGDHARVHDEIAAAKEAAGAARLKVILETGELGGYDQVRKASQIALDAGADTIKTSTGKISPAATPPACLVMLETIRDHYLATERAAGLKVAGGIRTAKQAWHYLVLVKETVGDGWLAPERFRIGASSLLDDVLRQRRRLMTGRYETVRGFRYA
jgi:deoxyribose-phosphate aldolase